MTKSKKILCLALAILMIAGAVFFAVYNKVGKKYDFGKIKDYSKYIKIGEVEGLSFYVDDSDIDAVSADDVTAQIAANLRALTADDNKNVTDTTAVIGDFDVVYVNFYGTYVDDASVTHVFVSGSRMDKSSPIPLYVSSGTASEYFANELKGKSPNPDAYKLKATGAEGDDSKIDADDIVYITYSWTRYKYQEGGAEIDEATKETNTSVDRSLVTTELRLKLDEVPAVFPAGFANKIVEKETVGAIDADKLIFNDVEIEGVKYQYQYQVEINRVIDEFNGIEVPYTFADDATDKDLEGNELKGKNVTFRVVIASFDDVPDFASTVPSDPEDENSEKVSVFFADDQLNFDATSYFTENVKDETAWLALEENAGKTHDDYIAYVGEQYKAYVEKGLTDTYVNNRMTVAAKPMWEKLLGQVSEVNAPKRALKLAKNDLLSQFKYVFNNATFENAAGKTVSYRTQYGSFKKFMNACYKSEDVIEALDLANNAAYNKAIEDGKSYGECVDAAANEIVRNKLLIYALYNKLGDAVKVDEAAFESERSLMYMYYYYGLSNTVLPDSALRESMMFDNVMKYIYDNADVQWDSAGANP